MAAERADEWAGCERNARLKVLGLAASAVLSSPTLVTFEVLVETSVEEEEGIAGADRNARAVVSRPAAISAVVESVTFGVTVEVKVGVTFGVTFEVAFGVVFVETCGVAEQDFLIRPTS
jgi:hypothetical protein